MDPTKPTSSTLPAWSTALPNTTQTPTTFWDPTCVCPASTLAQLALVILAPAKLVRTDPISTIAHAGPPARWDGSPWQE